MDRVGSADGVLFEGFRFDQRGGCLFRLDQGGVPTPVALGARALNLLGLLVERKGELVSKDEIMEAVWAGRVVEEANLNVQISKLRHILDQNRIEGSCIQTISGRGYRFVAPVTSVEPTNLPIFSGLFENGGGVISDAAERQIPAVPALRSEKRNRQGFWRVVAAVVVLLILAATVAFYWLSPSADLVAQHQISLWDAVIAGDVTRAMASIKTGADVNGLDTREKVAGPTGRKPLNYAALRNDTTMITTLVDAGAMINWANRSGFTPLHHAAEVGSEQAAILLIAKGANPSLRTMGHKTPVEIAMASDHSELADILQREMTRSR
jgi:DNA-binding winged helix-turn-helix (wHTH) protein